MKITLCRTPSKLDWAYAKKIALATMGREMKTLPDTEWKHRILEARHSPIRTLNYLFKLEDVPYWITVHLVRHVHAIPFVTSQRNDRQKKYDRDSAPQSQPVTMYWYMNAEELQIIANKRLCMKAHEKTREVVQLMCDEVIKKCPEYKDLLVPMCVYNGGACHEMFPCGDKR